MRFTAYIAFGCLSIAATLAMAADSAAVKVDQDHLKDYWTRAGRVANAGPVMPSSMAAGHIGGCVSVAFTIDAEGKPGETSILHSFVDKKEGGEEMRKQFEERSIAHVEAMRFKPAATNAAHKPVRTYLTTNVAATVNRNPGGRYAREQDAHCAVTDFAAK